MLLLSIVTLCNLGKHFTRSGDSDYFALFLFAFIKTLILEARLWTLIELELN